MSIEEIIAAQTRVIQVDGIAIACAGGIALLLAIVLMVIGRRDRSGFSDWAELCFGISVIVALVGLLLLPIGIYEYCTAGIQARGKIANYQLIDIRK